MKILLDTHVLIWAAEEPEKLGPVTRSMLTSKSNENNVSTISTLEIARLAQISAIVLQTSLSQWLVSTFEQLAMKTIELRHDIAIEAYNLPETFHKDPADRILVATARLHGLTLLTADEKILEYPHVKTRDARK